MEAMMLSQLSQPRLYVMDDYTGQTTLELQPLPVVHALVQSSNTTLPGLLHRW